MSNNPQHKSIEERVALFRQYYTMENERPLLIWGDIPEKDLDWIFSNLPMEGLAVNTVVSSPEQAEAIWRRNMI